MAIITSRSTLPEPPPHPKPARDIIDPLLRAPAPPYAVRRPQAAKPLWAPGAALQGPGSVLADASFAVGAPEYPQARQYVRRTYVWVTNIWDTLTWWRALEGRKLITAVLVLGASVAVLLYRLRGWRWAALGLAPLAVLPFLHVDFRPLLQISAEMQECIEIIQETLRELTEKAAAHYQPKAERKRRPSSPFILDVMLLKVLQEKRSQPALDFTNLDPKVADEAYAFMRHASAVYGATLCTALGLLEKDALPNPTNPIEADRSYIRVHCGLKNADIRTMNMHYMEVLSPNHYLAVDHAHRAVVLSICGTSNTSDLLTDLMATTTPFLNYRYTAHGGIAASAHNVLLRIGPDLQTLLREYPDYRLVLTGHSLGGGTAILATYLLLEDTNFQQWAAGRTVQCYAFAPPPVLSKAQVAECADADAREAIRIFAYRDDWICALSYASTYRLAQQLTRVAGLPLSRRQRLAIALSGQPDVVPDGPTAVQEFCGGRDIPCPDLPPLYHPGQLYWVQDHGRVARVPRAAAEALFQEIRITPAMATDHLQPFYERALDAVRKQAAAEVSLPTFSNPVSA